MKRRERESDEDPQRTPVSLTTAERIYRTLVRVLLPGRFRRESEAELMEVFRDGRGTVSGGPLDIMKYWVRTVTDLLVTCMKEAGWLGRVRQSEVWGRTALDVAAGAEAEAMMSVERGGTRGGLVLDARAAARDIVRSPGAAALGSLTLGTGIAATVLMLVLVRDVLLRPLPFEQPDRLVRLLERATGTSTDDVGVFWPSYPNVVDWRTHARVLDGVAAADVGGVQPVIAGGSGTQAVIGRVTRGFFATLGVAPMHGRTFDAVENAPGGAAVAVIGAEYWRGRLGGRPIDELSLEIGRDVFRVVGVLPAGFRFLGHGNAWLQADVWLPLERETGHGGRTSHGFHTIARLSTGIELDAARRAMNELAVRLRTEHGEATHADSIRVEPLMDAVLSTARPPLRLLLIASFVVLLVACFNLGASLLAKGIARGRELAVRAALGARRADMIRLLLVHAAVIALPGTVLGVAGAWCALMVVRTSSPAAVPRLQEAAMNPAAILLAVTLALVTATLAGLLPALTLSVRNVANEFRTHGAATGTRRQRWLWDGFVAGQTALTLVLLVSSAVLVRSLLSALAVDVGYRWNDVVIASVTLPERRFEEPARRVLFYDELMRRLRASPGVAAAGLVNVPPDEIYARIGPLRRPGEETQLWSGFRLVDNGFFETLGIPIMAGSLDAARDGALIDDNVASALWGDGARPVGERVIGSGGGPPTIVAGVTGSIRAWNQSTPIGAMYVHYTRVPQQLLTMHVVARGEERSTVADAMRQALTATDPVVPFALASLDERVRASMADRSLMMLIATGFAAVALFLAAAGVYALVAQAVARRRRESGIRLILGAHPRQVRRRIVRLGLRSCIAGVVLGVVASFAATRLIRAQLTDVAALDPLAVLASTLILLAAAWLASAVPARRAGRVDPIRLLRDD